MRFDHCCWVFRKFCVLVLVLSVLCAACSDQPSGDPGASAPGVRLAVLSPALADTLHRLGHAELIVGRQQFDRFTDQAVPVVGDLTGIDYESLILTRPTHIVAQRTAGGLPARLHALAAERGWEVVELDLLSLDDVVRSIPALDELGGGTGDEQARELVGVFEAMLSPDLELGRTVIVGSARPLSVIGPGAFHWEIVQRLGGEPLPDSGAAYIALGAESLAAMKAQTIVVLDPGGAPEQTREELLGAAAGLAMPALEQERLIVITDERCMLPSTALLGVIEQIREQAAELGPATDR